MHLFAGHFNSCLIFTSHRNIHQEDVGEDSQSFRSWSGVVQGSLCVKDTAREWCFLTVKILAKQLKVTSEDSVVINCFFMVFEILF